MPFTCPRGGEKYCSRTFKNLRGWKHHMTGSHNGYTDEELSAVTSDEGPDMFAKLGQSLDGGEPLPSSSMPIGAEIPPAIRPERKTAKLNAKKFKNVVGKIPLHFFESNGMRLSEDDTAAVEEAMDFATGIFGVSIQIEEKETVITNRFFALLYPLFVLAWVFFSNGGLEVLKKQAEKNAKQNNRGDRPQGKREDDRSARPFAVNQPGSDIRSDARTDVREGVNGPSEIA